MRFPYLTVLVIFLALIGCTDQEAEHSDPKNPHETTSNQSKDMVAKKPFDLEFSSEDESNGTFGGNSSPNDLGLPLPKQTKSSGPKNGLIKEYLRTVRSKKRPSISMDRRKGSERFGIGAGNFTSQGPWKMIAGMGSIRNGTRMGVPNFQGNTWMGSKTDSGCFLMRKEIACPT